MSLYNVNMDVDGSYKPIYSPLPFKTFKRITFAGGTTDAIGDIDGANNPATVFTVTGDVIVDIRAVCKTTLVGAGTLELGVTNATAALLAQIADATTLATNEGWADATPTLAEAYTPAHHTIGGGLDIILTAGSTNITAGVIDFYCFWRPLSSDGLIEAA